jgi:hypothetical protein
MDKKAAFPSCGQFHSEQLYYAHLLWFGSITPKCQTWLVKEVTEETAASSSVHLIPFSSQMTSLDMQHSEYSPLHVARIKQRN